MEQNVTVVFLSLKLQQIYSASSQRACQRFFVFAESSNQFNVVAVFCGFAKLEGV